MAVPSRYPLLYLAGWYASLREPHARQNLPHSLGAYTEFLRNQAAIEASTVAFGYRIVAIPVGRNTSRAPRDLTVSQHLVNAARRYAYPHCDLLDREPINI